MFGRSLGLAVCIVLTFSSASQARKWSDTTRRHTFEADLVGYNDDTAVLQYKNRDLVAVKVDHLSDADQEFLKSKEAEADVQRSAEEMPTWELQSGLKVKGRVVGYGRRDVTVQRKRGKIYANDRLFDNLPGVYQQLLPKVVGHFENLQIETPRDLMEWAKKTQGEPRKYVVEGVMLELENGDQYAVPFFVFSEKDRKLLEPGWKQWEAADQDSQERARQELMLQAQAQAYQRDQEEARQVKQLQLELLAVDAGVTDLWEVQLSSRQGAVSVVVPARNSRDATAKALAKYPNSVAGPVRKLN